MACFALNQKIDEIILFFRLKNNAYIFLKPHSNLLKNTENYINNNFKNKIMKNNFRHKIYYVMGDYN